MTFGDPYDQNFVSFLYVSAGILIDVFHSSFLYFIFYSAVSNHSANAPARNAVNLSARK